MDVSFLKCKALKGINGHWALKLFNFLLHQNKQTAAQTTKNKLNFEDKLLLFLPKDSYVLQF